MAEYNANVHEQVGIRMTTSMDLRASLSGPHLLSAAYFSRRLRQLELENRGRDLASVQWQPMLACATASVLICVAALEAYANELFVDHRERFPETKAELIVKLWELYEQKTILDKYELALLLRNAAPFDRGASPYQDVSALIKLRNGLTHFKPKWESEADNHKKISDALRYRIEPSPFRPSELLFPKAWASHSCTCWAIRSVIAFMDAFDERAGMKRHLEPFVDGLTS